MANLISSTLSSTFGQPSSSPIPIVQSTPSRISPDALSITPIITKIPKSIITSTIEYINSTKSGSFLEEGVGTALNAFVVTMLVLLGLCILFCVISSACWCYMKHKRDNRFNNFMSEAPGHPESRHEREEP